MASTAALAARRATAVGRVLTALAAVDWPLPASSKDPEIRLILVIEAVADYLEERAGQAKEISASAASSSGALEEEELEEEDEDEEASSSEESSRKVPRRSQRS